MNKPTSQQMSEVAPLKPCPFCNSLPTKVDTAQGLRACCEMPACVMEGRVIRSALWNRRAESPELSALRALKVQDVLVDTQAIQLAAFRARETRLWELLADIQHTCAVRKNVVGVDLKAVAWAHRLESILNEGKA